MNSHHALRSGSLQPEMASSEGREGFGFEPVRGVQSPGAAPPLCLESVGSRQTPGGTNSGCEWE